MLAQRYPDAYDGIAASAPAINWAQFIPAAAWAQVMMVVSGKFPSKVRNGRVHGSRDYNL
jgi:alpha-beta hydrolase superfamily lysophospholipase